MSDDRAVPAAGYILIADDDETILWLLDDLLTEQGYTVRRARSGPAALQLITDERPALVLLDMFMPGMTGADVITQLRSDGIRVPVVVMTAQRPAAEQLIDSTIACIEKPFALNRLLDCAAQHVLPA